jgi:hypothetical protein
MKAFGDTAADAQLPCHVCPQWRDVLVLTVALAGLGNMRVMQNQTRQSGLCLAVRLRICVFACAQTATLGAFQRWA